MAADIWYASAGMPQGAIVMWAGTLASVPAGWLLCDGTNGTPDLRDRFIMGWTNAVNPGGTGGATTHTHADHASLTHAGTAVANHTALTTGADSTTTGGVAKVVAQTPSAHAVTQPTAHPIQSHTAGDHTPVHFKLAFIQKT